MLEAINFALAGEIVHSISKTKILSIQFDKGLTITKAPTLEHPNATTRLIGGKDFNWLKDELFNVGDDSTLKGYY